jgi:hypothetical protein
MKASATIEITTIAKSASCDIKMGFGVNDASKICTL